MKRLGCYTGTVYPNDVDTSTIGECCVCIPPEHEDNQEWIQKETLRNKIRCGGCPGGCPKSMGLS